MKNINKLFVTLICLQLTVGYYPLSTPQAVAEEVVQNSSTGASRAPASTTQVVDGNEYFSETLDLFEEAEEVCSSKSAKNVNDFSKIAFGSVENIDGDSNDINNCHDLMEKISKDGHVDAMEKLAEYVPEKEDANCVNCGVPQGANGSQIWTGDISGEPNSCSEDQQKKFAAEKCNLGCQFASMAYIDGFVSGCDVKNRSGAGSCVGHLMTSLAKGWLDLLLFIPNMIKLGLTAVGEWTGLIKSENQTSNQAALASSLKDKDLELYQKDKEQFKQSTLSRLMSGLGELALELIGVGEYRREAICKNCADKAELACGVGGQTLSLLIGNGAIFGFQKQAFRSLAQRIVNRPLKKLFKGTAIASKTGKIIGSTSKGLKKLVQPLVWVGQKSVKLGSKIPGIQKLRWSNFKNGKFYQFLKNSSLNTSRVVKKGANTIPGKIVLYVPKKLNNGIKGINKFINDLKIPERTTKILNPKLARADNISKIRTDRLVKKQAFLAAASEETLNKLRKDDPLAQKIYEFRKENKIANSPIKIAENKNGEIIITDESGKATTFGKSAVDGYKKMMGMADDATTTEVRHHIFDQMEPKLNAEKIAKLRAEAKAAEEAGDFAKAQIKNAEATELALYGVEELRMAKKPDSIFSDEQWKKAIKDASNKSDGLKDKTLEGLKQGSQPVAFETNFYNKIDQKSQHSLMIDAPGGPREIFMKNPESVAEVHVYNDGKNAVVKMKDIAGAENAGSYVFYDLEKGAKPVGSVNGKNAEAVDTLLGKETSLSKSFEEEAYNQVKANLDREGTAYKEVTDEFGRKRLEIEAPNGCKVNGGKIIVNKAI